MHVFTVCCVFVFFSLCAPLIVAFSFFFAPMCDVYVSLLCMCAAPSNRALPNAAPPANVSPLFPFLQAFQKMSDNANANQNKMLTLINNRQSEARFNHDLSTCIQSQAQDASSASQALRDALSALGRP
jgi:hypothetical protein